MKKTLLKFVLLAIIIFGSLSPKTLLGNPMNADGNPGSCPGTTCGAGWGGDLSCYLDTVGLWASGSSTADCQCLHSCGLCLDPSWGYCPVNSD